MPISLHASPRVSPRPRRRMRSISCFNWSFPARFRIVRRFFMETGIAFRRKSSMMIPPFEPLRWARGAHAQTILGRYWSRHRLPSTDERQEGPVDQGDRLGAFLRRAPKGANTVVYLFHGLGGSSD